MNYLRSIQENDGKIADFATSSWAVMAIAAAGEDPNKWKVGSNPTIVDYLSTNVTLYLFYKREYEDKANEIVQWSEKFGLGKLKAGWTGRNLLSSDYEDPSLKTSLNLALASYGMRQLLTIITQVFWSKPGDLILIEEPEASLLPEAQVILQELFTKTPQPKFDLKYSIASSISLTTKTI